MNYLLLLFALPVATIIIASILETVLKSPIAVALLAFAIYLIVAFAAFDASFLVCVILYTILALVAAVITRVILNFINDNDDDDDICSIIENGNTSNISMQSTNCGCGSNNRYYRYR